LANSTAFVASHRRRGAEILDVRGSQAQDVAIDAGQAGEAPPLHHAIQTLIEVLDGD
jgi:hypothetical protein